MMYNQFVNRKFKPKDDSLAKELEEFLKNGGKIRRLPTKYQAHSQIDYNFFITNKEETSKRRV